MKSIIDRAPIAQLSPKRTRQNPGLSMLALLLLSLAVTAFAAVSMPSQTKPRKPLPGRKTGQSTATRNRKRSSVPLPSRGSKRPSARHGKASGLSPHARSSRSAGRARPSVDPVSRLDAVGTIASTLSRGSSSLSFLPALDGFYAALAQHEEQPEDGTVRVLQFGDSHTAADMFTGEARRVLQREFGNGSIGYSYAGHPFAGYRIFGSQRTQSGGWATEGTHFADLGDGLLGMGGVGVSTAHAGEFITLDAPCTSLEVDYLEQPDGGSIHLTDNGVPVSDIATSAPATAPGAFTYSCPESTTGDHHFAVTTESDAPVRLLGLVALQPGLTWESIGINGAEAPLILRWNQQLFTNYLRSALPSLIVLAYGTNEAAARYDPESYSAIFGRIVDTLHQTSPDASILVLGPTDRAIASHRAWHAFTGTDPILEAQRTICRTHNCAFWDQRRRMGGLGSMQHWVRAGWAQRDHTHLTGEGYRALADALLADVLSGYDGYRKQHGLPSSTGVANAVQQNQTVPSTSPTH